MDPFIRELFIVGLLNARHCARHRVLQVSGYSKCAGAMCREFLECSKNRREHLEKLRDWARRRRLDHTGISQVLKCHVGHGEELGLQFKP